MKITIFVSFLYKPGKNNLLAGGIMVHASATVWGSDNCSHRAD